MREGERDRKKEKEKERNFVVVLFVVCRVGCPTFLFPFVCPVPRCEKAGSGISTRYMVHRHWHQHSLTAARYIHGPIITSILFVSKLSEGSVVPGLEKKIFENVERKITEGSVRDCSSIE